MWIRASPRNVSYSCAGLMGDLLPCCHSWPGLSGHTSRGQLSDLDGMQPGSGGGEDPREEPSAVAAAQDRVIWKMS